MSGPNVSHCPQRVGIVYCAAVKYFPLKPIRQRKRVDIVSKVKK
jgi:hypothetical protein